MLKLVTCETMKPHIQLSNSTMGNISKSQTIIKSKHHIINNQRKHSFARYKNKRHLQQSKTFLPTILDRYLVSFILLTERSTHPFTWSYMDHSISWPILAENDKSSSEVYNGNYMYTLLFVLDEDRDNNTTRIATSIRHAQFAFQAHSLDHQTRMIAQEKSCCNKSMKYCFLAIIPKGC